MSSLATDDHAQRGLASTGHTRINLLAGGFDHHHAAGLECLPNVHRGKASLGRQLGYELRLSQIAGRMCVTRSALTQSITTKNPTRESGALR